MQHSGDLIVYVLVPLVPVEDIEIGIFHCKVQLYKFQSNPYINIVVDVLQREGDE